MIGEIVVDTEFKGRSIQVRRGSDGTYYCYDNGKMTQRNISAEAVMGWLANMMMNA